MAEALGAAELRELIRHIMEDGFNQADMAMVHASFHPDYRRHGFGGPVTHGGPRHWQNPPVPPHTIEDGATLLVDRRSQWVAFGGEWAETDDFTDMGEAFMAAHPPHDSRVGVAPSRWRSMVAAVDFATPWFAAHRGRA